MSGRDGTRLSGERRSADFANVEHRPSQSASSQRASSQTADFSDLRDFAELRDAEQNARRALGLGPGGNAQGRPRRRFARDGEVAVVVLQRSEHPPSDSPPLQAGSSPPVNRLAAAETARDAERSGRLRAERALAEAQATVRQLQTQLGHAGMTQTEAVEASRRALAEKEVLELSLAAERDARAQAEQALAKALTRRGRPARADAEPTTEPAAPRQVRVVRASRTSDDPAKKPARGMRRAPEPKPVKWWVKPRG